MAIIPENNAAPFPVVGIGASAGGLRALENFFQAMPPAPGMAFVIITHLAPDRKSLLTEILARHTALNVDVARDDQPVEKDKVYILPPGAILTIANGRLRLEPTDAIDHQRKPIDIFFSSLAQDQGEYAVGVVLSGSGADGVLGVKAIKEHGGVTLAQAIDATGPGFSGMPDSAIASGLVDFAIPVDAMASKLIENLGSFDAFEALLGRPRANDDGRVVDAAREAICALLFSQTGHDFSGYKTRTFMRRVQRRMQARQCEAVENYIAYLRENPDEAGLLFRDLLINVTSFFRDKDAFAALERTVIPRLFEKKGASDWVRVWAPGCATGEEAVSIAILLREHMAKLPVAPRVTIFATEMDEAALNAARAGRYPEALMESVSPERRQRFFIADPGGYVVAKEVRDLCVFSAHDILRDPPFSRMDLISCRNLLIYFKAQAQGQMFPVFHYALRPHGILFLGMSESIGRFTDLFEPLDKRHCLFQARDTGLPTRMPLIANKWRPASFGIHLPRADSARSGSQLRQSVESRVLDQFAPPHVVVNDEGDIVYFSSRTGKWLEASPGAPTRQLLTMARKGLRLELRGALREAIENRRTVRRNLKVESEDDGAELISLIVEPLSDSIGDRRLFLVLFDEHGRAPGAEEVVAKAADSADGVAAAFEGELRETRDRLQSTIEEYETTLDELKSANEELVSLNEEMQSSNEELESSKEELQSLNEELQTVNHELSDKVEELDRANSDLRNVFVSTQIATVFLDQNLVIRSFTPAASELFSIIPTDAGRPLTDLATKLAYPELQADIRKVLDTGTLMERRACTSGVEPLFYIARITPYSDTAGKISGVVATFVDISSLTRSEEYVRELHADRLSSMAEMASGLAHELNQPLSAIATYLKAIRRLLQLPPQERPASVDEALDHATDQIMRAGKIIRHLREFVANGEPNMTHESLHNLIREVFELTIGGMKDGKIQMVLALNADKDGVLVDKVEIKQVLVNLILNASEAMAASPNREITIATSLVENEMIQIDVSDTGRGMSGLDKKDPFEPFLTTKENGLGVGLSISRLIVEAHYGKIWARPNPAGGAVFSFTLPLAAADADP
ncbi:MAG: chemotaxis protein CheB [Methylocystis sp.]